MKCWHGSEEAWVFRAVSAHYSTIHAAVKMLSLRIIALRTLVQASLDGEPILAPALHCTLQGLCTHVTNSDLLFRPSSILESTLLPHILQLV